MVPGIETNRNDRKINYPISENPNKNIQVSCVRNTWQCSWDALDTSVNLYYNTLRSSVGLFVCLCVCMYVSILLRDRSTDLLHFLGKDICYIRLTPHLLFMTFAQRSRSWQRSRSSIFFLKFGKFDELSRKLKILFSKISYKFHENLEIFTQVASIQVTHFGTFFRGG